MRYELFETMEDAKRFIRNCKPGGWIGSKKDFREYVDELRFFETTSESYIERMNVVVIWNR